MRIAIIIFTLLGLFGCGNTNNNASLNDNLMTIARNNGCLECHAIHAMKIGPPWDKVASRYKNIPNAESMLIKSVKNGSKDKWNTLTGGAVMPPNSPRVRSEDIKLLVESILSLGKKTNQPG